MVREQRSVKKPQWQATENLSASSRMNVWRPSRYQEMGYMPGTLYDGSQVIVMLSPTNFCTVTYWLLTIWHIENIVIEVYNHIMLDRFLVV